jgi:arylsulfatase A-like enzyme
MEGETSGPLNVILVSFDTLRRDHLGSYGYQKDVSPALDRLATEGVVFEDAVANCGWTLPQHVTMLTGLHPLRHGLVYLRRRCRIPAATSTLADAFRKAGYVTLGFCNQNAYGGGWRYGFQKGMNHFTNVLPFNNMMEKAVVHVNAYLELLRDKPFFMYIHTNDTHEHFAASEPFGSKWGSSYHNRYEGEISYVDHYFGQILKELEDLGISDRTLVVATSDHGSEFKEHGFLEKKLNLYEEIVQVPVVMRLPALLPAGRRIGGQAETVDIAPTILDLCSLDLPGDLDGRSMLSRIQDNEPGPESVFAHTLHETLYWYEHWSVRTERYKLILTLPLHMPKGKKNLVPGRFERLDRVAEKRGNAWVELYDIKKDPSERSNIADGHWDLCHTLGGRISDWTKACGYAPLRELPSL